MKFRVTGGTGFIGARVVRNLLARGTYPLSSERRRGPRRRAAGAKTPASEGGRDRRMRYSAGGERDKTGPERHALTRIANKPSLSDGREIIAPLKSSMPVRPEYKWFYPIDWPQLSAVIRFERAKGRCERCGRPHAVRSSI